jgi:hypothetical protein
MQGGPLFLPNGNYQYAPHAPCAICHKHRPTDRIQITTHSRTSSMGGYQQSDTYGATVPVCAECKKNNHIGPAKVKYGCQLSVLLLVVSVLGVLAYARVDKADFLILCGSSVLLGIVLIVLLILSTANPERDYEVAQIKKWLKTYSDYYDRNPEKR